MRYFLVKYSKKASGQMDEIVSVSKGLKTKDLQMSAVILDFKTRQVILSSLDGKTVPKDWNRIRDFYHQHYKRIIEDLESVNAVNPDTAQGSK